MPVHLKNTTWHDYINDALLHSGHITKAGIFGLNSGETWAASEDFHVSTDVVRLLTQSFIDPSKIVPEGIPLEDTDYVCVVHEDRLIVGRKMKRGCILAKCNKCMIVALFDDISHAMKCQELVWKLAQYFINHDI